MTTDNKMSLASDLLAYAPTDIHEQNGELQVVKTLTEDFAGTI
jgi:hypothetical protein